MTTSLTLHVRFAQVAADDVAVVVLHLATPPPPAHPGRPAFILPAATTAADANGPAYLAASRAAAALHAPRSAAAAAPAVPVPAAATHRDATVVEAPPDALQTGRKRSGALPPTALQDPAAAPRDHLLKVVTQRRAPDRGAGFPALPSASVGGPGAAAEEFRTDSAYAHDLRCVSRGLLTCYTATSTCERQ